MPRSKRDRTVALTKTSKKEASEKDQLVDRIRTTVDSHENLFVLGFDGLRSNHLQTIRVEFRDSRLFLGKNKITQLALGKTPEDEYQDNLRRVAALVSGSVGLLATNRSSEEVERWFDDFEVDDFAKVGFVAQADLRVERGPMPQFEVSMCPTLRKLGMSIQVDHGKLDLLTDFILCRRGKAISAEQAKALVHFNIKLVKFKVRLMACWSGGSFTEMDV
jgi:mRNA turnover protein 4